MSQFDPDTFLDTSTEKANETVYTPVPEGDYQAMVLKVEGRSANESPLLDVTFEILDEEIKKTMDQETVTVRSSIFLDLDDNGMLSFGMNKNVRLGKLRDALGQNKDGKPWMPRQLEGAGPLMINVTQRPDKNDSSIIYNDVRKFAPMK